MNDIRITIQNIEQYRGSLGIQPGDLDGDMRSIFDRSAFDNLADSRVVPIDRIVSTKNQLEDPKFLSGTKPDPRQTAFQRMQDAMLGKLLRRVPIAVEQETDGTLNVVDGNATVQVLMLAGWKKWQ